MVSIENKYEILEKARGREIPLKFTPSTSPKILFKVVYKGETNILTPEVIQIYTISEARSVFCEISTGEGFLSRKPLYGLTVIQGFYRDQRILVYNAPISTCVRSWTEIWSHLHWLKELFS